MCDDRWNNVVWCHGLSAYGCPEDEDYVNDDPVFQFKKFLVHPEWEIAATRKGEELGPYGVYVKGEVLNVFSRDVGSYIEMGTRYPSNWGWDFCISDKYEEYVDAKPTGEGLESYFEAHVTDFEIQALWISKIAWEHTEWYTFTHKELLEIARTAYYNGIPVLVGNRQLELEDLYKN